LLREGKEVAMKIILLTVKRDHTTLAQRNMTRRPFLSLTHGVKLESGKEGQQMPQLLMAVKKRRWRARLMMMQHIRSPRRRHGRRHGRRAKGSESYADFLLKIPLLF
jgi:hypothetical protein